MPVAAVEIEIVCSDAGKHRRGLETRAVDVAGLMPRTWREIEREIERGGYQPWDRAHAVIDTASCAVEDAVAAIETILARGVDYRRGRNRN